MRLIRTCSTEVSCFQCFDLDADDHQIYRAGPIEPKNHRTRKQKTPDQKQKYNPNFDLTEAQNPKQKYTPKLKECKTPNRNTHTKLESQNTKQNITKPK